MNIGVPQTEQDWQAYYELRWRLLRAPWQQPIGSERDEWEHNAYHVMAKDELGQAIAVGRIHRVAPGDWQIRYMAVDEAKRGQGIGARILKALEDHARAHQVRRILLNARESAVAFYLRYNYRVCGEAPTLFGVIKHQRMQKDFPDDGIT